jgi:hypothetical protein
MLPSPWWAKMKRPLGEVSTSSFCSTSLACSLSLVFGVLSPWNRVSGYHSLNLELELTATTGELASFWEGVSVVVAIMRMMTYCD